MKDQSVTATHRFLRIKQVLELIPVSKSCWWKNVKDGNFPQPVKLTPGTTAWREKDILDLLERLAEGN